MPTAELKLHNLLPESGLIAPTRTGVWGGGEGHDGASFELGIRHDSTSRAIRPRNKTGTSTHRRSTHHDLSLPSGLKQSQCTPRARNEILPHPYSGINLARNFGCVENNDYDLHLICKVQSFVLPPCGRKYIATETSRPHVRVAARAFTRQLRGKFPRKIPRVPLLCYARFYKGTRHNNASRLTTKASEGVEVTRCWYTSWSSSLSFRSRRAPGTPV